MLASIEGQVVALVIAGIVALINWMMKKPEAGNAAAPAPRPGADAEAERMRKFMEALGLPANQAPKPVARPAVRRAQAAPPPIPRARPLVPAPAPRLPVERLHVPELRVPEVAEFHTKSAEVSAIPMESKPIAAPDPYAGTQRQTPVDEMRRLLRSPADIRAAILLREILGPPRGLQS